MIRSLLLIALLAGSLVHAKGSIFLNGVNIDGTTGVEIDKASVRIDAQGNVHVSAPGYQVQRPDGSAITGSQARTGSQTRVLAGPDRPTRRYWLVSELSPSGLAGYDVDVHINGELAFRIRQQDPQLSQEITKRLRAGANTVRIEARKVDGPGPDLGSRTPFLRIHLGEGVEQAERIVLERPQHTFSLKANERGNKVQEAVLEVR